MCGGTGGCALVKPPVGGLSPRVRGNRAQLSAFRAVSRSIPACAGEPHHPGRGISLVKVYPRVCGGTVPATARWASAPGSIPACAGEPIFPPVVAWLRKVYPRVCGGTWLGAEKRMPVWGLSPRVRGNQVVDVVSGAGVGSIPACAGEPGQTDAVPSGDGVYPRVCGGTAVQNALAVENRGLSPRVRGNLVAVIQNRQNRGSIPACAGEPRGFCRAADGVAVYPRVCGGTAASGRTV